MTKVIKSILATLSLLRPSSGRFYEVNCLPFKANVVATHFNRILSRLNLAAALRLRGRAPRLREGPVQPPAAHLARLAAAHRAGSVLKRAHRAGDAAVPRAPPDVARFPEGCDVPGCVAECEIRARGRRVLSYKTVIFSRSTVPELTNH